MGLIKFVRMGSWWLESKSDPRWNCYGEGYVGGFMMPMEAQSKFNELKKKFGESPEDLEWGYM